MAKKKKEPSKVERKFEIHIFQIIGIPIMILVPILALFGLFGESVDTMSTSNQQLEVSVEYPTRFRFRMIDEITVSLTNVAGQSLPSVLVSFDRQYTDGKISIVPENAKSEAKGDRPKEKSAV